MNLEQLIEEVNQDIDDSLDSGDITKWINRGLDNLTPIAKKEAKSNIEISPPIKSPEDLFEIVHLFAGEDEYLPVPIKDRSSKGYKIWGDEITLQGGPETGEIEVYYYKRLTHLEDSEDVPEIDPSFHDLLILYAVAHSQFAEEEPERQIDAMNRYMQRKREFESFVARQSNETYQVRMV